MGIKKDEKTGTWSAFYAKRHPTTRTPVCLRRVGLKDEREARLMERKLIIEIQERLETVLNPTWRAVVEKYLIFARDDGSTERTIYDYQTGLEAYTMEKWAKRRIDSITTPEIRDLVNVSLSDRGVGTRKNALKFIRAVFSYALEMDYVDRNPCPKMKFRIGDKLKGVLTEPQVRVLLQKAKEMNVSWYPHWLMAVYTGMRSGELYALTWDKVNLETRQIIVDSSWNSKDGFKSTKSGDDRIIEIAPPLLETLKELKLRSAGCIYVLPRIVKWDRGGQAEELRMFLLGCGLPSVRFHDLRATWATLLLSKGVEPIKVMKMGGWKDMKTMMIYIRKAGVDISGATDNLNLHNPRYEPARVLSIGHVISGN
jgi:integrase